MSWGANATGGLAGASVDGISSEDLNTLLAAWNPDGSSSGVETGGLASLASTPSAPSCSGDSYGNKGGKFDSWGNGDSWGMGKGDSFGKGDSWGGCGKGEGMFGDSGKGCGFGKGLGKDKSKGKGASRLAAGEQCYSGRIKSWIVEKKSGYIVCDEISTMCGQEVYIFGDILAQSLAGPGDTVAFFLHWSPSGQPQASAPVIRIACADSYALKGQYKPATDGKEHGFLLCDLSKDFFGRDIYVNKELAATLTPGQFVAFNVFLNREKMPNAERAEVIEPSWEPIPGDLSITRTDPTVISVAVNGSCKGGLPLPSMGKDGWMGKDGGMGKDCGMGFKGGKGDDGWGYGKDCGKGKDGGKSKESMWSMFNSMFGDWGGDAWGGGGNWGGDGGWGSKGAGKGKDAWGGGDNWGGGYDDNSKGKGKGKSHKGTGEGVPPTPTGETYYGVIKSYNSKNNYGFIASDDIKAKYGGDCFMSGRNMGALNVGDMVEFDVGVNSKGSPQALNVRPIGEPALKAMRLE